MADRYNASIRIGGTIDRNNDSKADPEISALNMLVALINGADVSHEFGDAVAVICEGEDDALLAYTDDNGLLEFKGEQVPNGEFTEIEEFLREQGIPYNRSTCAYGGFMGEDVYYLANGRERETSDTSGPFVYMRTPLESGEEIVPADMRKFEEETLSKAQGN